MNTTFTSFATEIATEAGKILLNFYNNLSLDQISYKNTSDLVTQADQSSEKYIVSKIEQEFPEHNIYGEEFTDKKTSSEYTWIVDPLDGTTNFVHSHPFFCVSIGLQHKGKTISGVVHAPVLRETFSASLGEGSYLNDKKLRVSKSQTLQKSLLATGFPYEKDKIEENNLNNVNTLIPKIRGLRRCGAAALDLCYVGCGRYDGYWELWLKPHDCAAGTLVVTEAGGKVTDFTGGENCIFNNNLVASNGCIHEELRQNLSLK